MAVEWSNMNSLEKLHTDYKQQLKQKASRHKWIQTFPKVASVEAISDLSFFANEIVTYLQSDEGSKLYKEAFNLHIDGNLLKRRIEAVSGNTRKLIKLAETERLNEDLRQGLAQVTSYSYSPATTSQAKSSSRYVSVKKRLFDDANSLHTQYVNNEKLTCLELKLMSIGLSEILDCIDYQQAKALGREDYDYVQRKYSAKYGIKFSNDKPVIWSKVVHKRKSSGINTVFKQ